MCRGDDAHHGNTQNNKCVWNCLVAPTATASAGFWQLAASRHFAAVVLLASLENTLELVATLRRES